MTEKKNKTLGQMYWDWRLKSVLPSEAAKIRYRSSAKVTLGVGLLLLAVGSVVSFEKVVRAIPVLGAYAGFVAGMSEFLARFVPSVGEGLLVACVLAVLVDPYLKAELASGIGDSLFWALHSKDAPDDYRSALRILASIKRYFRDCRWEMTFKWADPDHKVLEVGISVRSTGVCLNKDGLQPGGIGWVMASIEGYQTRNERWAIEAPEQKGLVLDRSAQDLVPYSKARADGSVGLDIAQLVADWEKAAGQDLRIDFKSHYVSRRSVTVFKGRNDLIPLVHGLVVLDQELLISGEALGDLDISVFKDGEWSEAFEHSGIDGKARKYVFKETIFPNQSTLVSWRVKPPTPAAPAA